MYGWPRRYGPSSDGWGQSYTHGQPPAPPYFEHNQALQELNVFLQSGNGLGTPQHHNLNVFSQNPNVPFQNHSFAPQQPSIPACQQHRSPHTTNGLVEKINRAVARAGSDLIAAGESITTWKVSQSALSALKVDSWESLGCRLREVSSLDRLMRIEGRITSLHDLEVSICEHARVMKFEDLELGPLLRHPLVLHYFSVSSEMTEVFKITCEEIIHLLCQFMDVCESRIIRVEAFLDFITKKLSVKKREFLGIRFKKLGKHVSAIHQAMKSEDCRLKKFTKSLEAKSGSKCWKKNPIFALQKQQRDTRSGAITRCVESFSSCHKNCCGKHIRFVSSSSEGEDACDCMSESGKSDSGNEVEFSLYNNRNWKRVSTSPYPSSTEEKLQLGLKGEVQGLHSPGSSLQSNNHGQWSLKKRKSMNFSRNKSRPLKLHKKDNLEADIFSTVNRKDTNGVNDMQNDNYEMADDAYRMFISTWKDDCRSNTVEEVFMRMLQSCKPQHEQRKKIKHMFLLYPFIGLLNVAVSSIKLGMWDSIYDTFQPLSHRSRDSVDTIDGKYSECDCDVDSSAKDLSVIQRFSEQSDSISVEDIIRKVEKYVEIEIRLNNSTFLQHKIFLLKMLCRCEFWLAEQFSVKEFNSIGYGDFFMFLEKYISLLPKELYHLLATYECERYPLDACMFSHQLIFLIAQAFNNLWENEKITKQMISSLLRRQYPFISFKALEGGSLEKLLDIVEKQKDNIVSKSVIFSGTLVETFHLDKSLVHDESNCFGSSSTRVFESSSSKDAIEVLVKAPMLLDLNLWSHWDLLFAPSLGPLVPWLLNEVNTEELLCLVTKDGKVLRLDHRATADSFFEAAGKGSSFQSAVKLLSLFSLVGGEKHVPLSLLKCHARHAFEVFLKNSSEEGNEKYIVARHGELSGGINILGEITANNLNRTSSKGFNKLENSITMLSKFVLDCISYLPTEFRGFAADVLLYGCQTVIKNAPLVILHECRQPQQRLMLHEVGLCLGIVEWIDDHNLFSSADTSSSFAHEAEHSNASSNVIIGELPRPEDLSKKLCVLEKKFISSTEELHDEKDNVCPKIRMAEIIDNENEAACSLLFESERNKDPALVIESIRQEEFGLEQNIPYSESCMLMKQHARLGRALHCLSQELYSQDSHFLLELIQNADDNIYPENVKPTLTFILQESAIVVLNNEQGFSSQNI